MKLRVKLIYLTVGGVSLLFTMEGVPLQNQTWKESWRWCETVPCLQRREGRGIAEGREQPASTHQGSPGQAASSSGCLHPHTRALNCLWIKLKAAQNPPFPSSRCFPLLPPCLELWKCIQEWNLPRIWSRVRLLFPLNTVLGLVA